MGKVYEDALGLIGAVLGREGVPGEDVPVEIVLCFECVYEGVEFDEGDKTVGCLGFAHSRGFVALAALEEIDDVAESYPHGQVCHEERVG